MLDMEVDVSSQGSSENGADELPAVTGDTITDEVEVLLEVVAIP